MKGSYILVIYLAENDEFYIGSLGKLYFNLGFYIYIGSAMGNYGSSTLENRVRRHFQPSKNKKIRWHIDYLLNQKKSVIIQIYLIPSSSRLECVIAKDLKKHSNKAIENFGSSDCRCQSHLFYFKEFKGISILSDFK